MNPISVIVPFYRNPLMLQRQLDEWANYETGGYTFIVVDDGSPEPAIDVIQAHPVWRRAADGGNQLRLYRVTTDIPWNRGGARNLGANEAKTAWILHIDIDHILPAASAKLLQAMVLEPWQWYRFPRFRQGRADATRRKDKIPTEQRFGEIHPHVDSYLCERALYWRVGGYDEDYSGCLGGGNPFLRQLEAAAKPRMMPPDIALHVYTRDAVPDASDTTLSRSSEEYSRRRKAKEAAGRTVPIHPIRFPWERVL